MKKYGYDENGNRIWSKFTGLPIQPLEYHLMMFATAIVFVGLIVFGLSWIIEWIGF